MNHWEQLLSCLPSPPDFRWNWDALQGMEPVKTWAFRMAETPQNPDWHGEGDVWTHTRMVCEVLAELEEFRAMAERPGKALALATLLHDVGKFTCTRLQAGELVSPHHGPKGAQMVREVLWRDFGLSGDPDKQQFREAVCLLIRYHTTPLHLGYHSRPGKELLKMAANGELAPDFTLNALSLLAEADVRGRIAPDTAENLTAIEHYREAALEEDCLEGPYPFASGHTRRVMFKGGNVWKGQTLYDDTWGEVILMCGLPGTGKDTWIRANHPDLPVVSLDALRKEMKVARGRGEGKVVQAAKEQAKAYLRAKQPFIWNATSLTTLRDQQVELFENYHARVRIVYLETGWEENLRRNAERKDAVPEKVLEEDLKRLELPLIHEAWQVDWITVG